MTRKSPSRLLGACSICLLLLLLFCGLSASAQTVSPQQVADLQKQVAEARGNADNAWMLVSSALVLMMTGPGLALFYGGTLILLKLVDATVGLRVSGEHEVEGLDLTQHGEEGYSLE